MYNGKIVWEFKTARFRVTLETLREYDYRYDGDDEDGSTQAALDCGDLVAFDTTVTVCLDGRPIGESSARSSGNPARVGLPGSA